MKNLNANFVRETLYFDSLKRGRKPFFNILSGLRHRTDPIHSRDMKTQHIKYEILDERLTLFKCNLIQFKFVLKVIVIGRICNANFHPFGDVRDDVTRSLDVCHR